MALLKLHPSCKSYLWGGHRLVEEYHKEYTGDVLAETWELSCRPEGASTMENGSCAGMTLREYIRYEGWKVLGSRCRRFEEFPILIKFIDAKKDLSIQVHPDDEYARKHEGQYGKSEMWYVMDCEEGASLYYGFDREISKEEFLKRIQENTLTEVLHKVAVQKGDVFFIEAGTIHAIGSGIVIAEIQQNSNVTYRGYDYGRVDKNGKTRELHIDKVLDVTRRGPVVRRKTSSPHLACCDYFVVDKLNLDGNMTREIAGTIGSESFVSVLIIEGTGEITCGDETMEYQKGDSFFMTAGSGEYKIAGTCEALITTVGEQRQTAALESG